MPGVKFLMCCSALRKLVASTLSQTQGQFSLVTATHQPNKKEASSFCFLKKKRCFSFISKVSEVGEKQNYWTSGENKLCCDFLRKRQRDWKKGLENRNHNSSPIAAMESISELLKRRGQEYFTLVLTKNDSNLVAALSYCSDEGN